MAPKPKPERQRAKHYFKEWRVMLYPNQTDAEEKLGWSQSKVSRLESGATPYNQDDLEHAAEVFGCSPIDLISWPPNLKDSEATRRLRTALLAYGIDGDRLDLAVGAVSVLLRAREVQSSQDQSRDLSQSSNRPHESEPSRSKSALRTS